MLRPRVQVQPVTWAVGLDSDLAAWRQLDSIFLSYDPHFSRLASHIITPTERLEIILSHQSLHVRASDLATFISHCPPEALKDNFKLIVNSIFTNNDREQTWDLRNIRRHDHPLEAAAVLRLLAPDGPLISLALRLMDDHRFLLEFPMEGLPLQLQTRLRGMDVPPFFSNKLQVSHPFAGVTRAGPSLLLNPFEYYMFCFASLNVLGLLTGRPGDYLNGWAAMQDTLYTNVLEEYLVYYFPCNGGGVPSHNFNFNPATHGREPVFVANSLLKKQQQQSTVNPSLSTGSMSLSQADNLEKNLPKLFKPSVLQQQAVGIQSRDNLFLSTHPSAFKEIWRSETVLHVFMELWMCGYHTSLDKVDNFASSSPVMYGGLPSVEVVKSVRMLVRHLHFFMNCLNNHAMHPMEEIRRTSLPLFQRRLYSFLRYLFHHWPLDNSFRIVYETWLSYIQPWRYTNFDRYGSNRNALREANEQSITVDHRWSPFILDNILFYSKLFSEMLKRLARVDLIATKNALMLFRMAKVYTVHENLKLMLRDIELSIEAYEKQTIEAPTSSPVNPLSTTVHSSRVRFSYSSPTTRLDERSHAGGFQSLGKVSPARSLSQAVPSSPTSFLPDYSVVGAPPNTAKLAHLKQLMKDFENAGYVYESIFSQENIKLIQSLITAAGEAKNSLLVTNPGSNTLKKGSVLALATWINSFVSGEPKDSSLGLANMAERKKAANHLEFARNAFAAFFDLPLPDTTSVNLSSPSTSNGQSCSTSYLEDSFTTLSSSQISSQMMNSFVANGSKLRLKPGVLVESDETSYGNPDKALVRSDECRALVRLWYSIASFFNYVFEDKIDEMYFSSSWAGRYLRAMLAEPIEYTLLQRKTGPGDRGIVRSTQYLPPRVHLRFFASHAFFGYLLVILAASTLFRLGPLGTILGILLLYILYLTFVATSEPLNKLEELRQLRSRYQAPANQSVAGPSTSAMDELFPRTSTPNETDMAIQRRRSGNWDRGSRSSS